ncbi:translocase of outer mitochondrial membrane subunit 5 [Neurospora crassa]|nr:translocase of outer mitochondrial membrane subunit 5 [Neurospora crassa]
MFGGFQPPALSREELQAAEAEATFTIQRAVFTAVALYLCSSTYLPACPPQLLSLPYVSLALSANKRKNLYTAPFVIDAVSKVL